MLIGTVTQVNLYPVKSMQGIPVQQAQLWWYGLDGDRKAAFVRSDNQSHFPWLTGREYPDLVRYEAYFTDPKTPDTSPIRVKTRSGLDLALDDPELLRDLSQKSGHPLHLMRLNRGVFDCMPVSVISQTLVQTLADSLKEAVDTRRFRANIVIDVEPSVRVASDGGFPEAKWLNKTITFGNHETGAQVQADYEDRRCAMINIDPDTSERNPTILKKVAQLWDACAGIYGATRRLGTVCVGDEVHLSD
ncbi:MAG: MOSC N-terminal beta barrel domain-containing protein [Chloroflexota bacterium]